MSTLKIFIHMYIGFVQWKYLYNAFFGYFGISNQLMNGPVSLAISIDIFAFSCTFCSLVMAVMDVMTGMAVMAVMAVMSFSFL